jgi:hypothetical protein
VPSLRSDSLCLGSAFRSPKWKLGIGWYEEVRDSGTNSTCEQLPVGEFSFACRPRAAAAGTFNVAPAALQSMYVAEFIAFSPGETMRRLRVRRRTPGRV